MVTPHRINRRPHRGRRIFLAFLVLALFVLVPSLVRFEADRLWFQQLGFERVFATQYLARYLLGIGVGLLAWLFIQSNLRLALRGLPEPSELVQPIPVGPAALIHIVRRIAGPAALALGFFFAVASAGSWLTVLRFLHQTPFGTADPVFGRDVSYYVFTLPLIVGVLRIVTLVLTVSLVGALVVYLVRGELSLVRRQTSVNERARLHLALLIAALFVVGAVRTVFVRMPDLLYSTTGPLSGASFADLHAKLPALWLSALASIVGAGIVLWAARGERLVRGVTIALAINFGVSVLALGLYPSLVNRLVVAPNELSKEAPQLARHIAATREAWGLDSVVVRDLSGEAQLTEKDITASQGTIDNIRLWDRDPLRQTFGQLQEIRTYYDFLSVDDDRYHIDGRYRQVLLSPRELNAASLPTRTFINERLTFTHGMGLTLSPVNEVTNEGLPVLFVKDLPPASSVSLKVTRPQIYYGEISDSWVFANTKQREFDYPSGDENVYTSYTGEGGVRVGTFGRRLLFAAYFGSMKVLLSSDITNDSRAMYYRNIRERATKALPFLVFDNDPYIVIDDAGKLHWIMDAYTRTTRYPYADPLRGGINYMRNSAKVTIDAYTGAVDAYLADAHDPIVLTYAKIFPGIFHPLEEMPADLRAHLRYPEVLFRAQADMYAKYHMNEPATFYHQEDQWQRPAVQGNDAGADPFLRHIVMQLPGEPQAEYVYMVPFTPRGKDNLASWMVARNDAPHYGQLVVYRLPKQSLIFGPTQIVNRINQDTEISRQISLWDQRGSEVIRGNLLVIPIAESLIYVQPIYLRAQGGRIPELKRVVVAYQNQVVMEETLTECLTRMFGGVVAHKSAEPEPVPAATGGSSGELVRQASDIYQRAMSAQRAGDWSTYGSEIKRLGEVLKQLEAGTKE